MQQLVYNQVWEDYAVDRAAFGVGADDDVFTITSGGCNVLNTLTEATAPRRIVAIDVNAGQRALLDDKMRLIRRGDHAALWRAYGVPAQRDAGSVYARGAYGRFAWVRRFMRLVVGRRTVERFAAAASLDEQRAIYLREVEPRLFGPTVRALPTALAGVCGMHWRQVASTLTYGRFRLQSVCRLTLRHVLTSYPIRENYYWHQMLTGAYAGPAESPPYLRAEHFAALQRHVKRVENLQGCAIAYLRATPDATFTCINLADVPEFLSPARREQLFREVKRVAAPGARILYRSFAPDVPVPASCNGESPGGLRFSRDLSADLTRRERTASYGAVHLYTA